jgi:predicted Zn-dependent peptidase
MNKRFLHISLLATLLLGFCNPLANSQDIDKLEFPKLNKLEIPEIERVTLDNGLRLYLTEDKTLPRFRVSVSINAGSYLEPAEKVGLVEILGEVLRTGGTTKWTGDEIDEMLEGVGASVETSGDLLACNASVTTLSEYTDLGLDVLMDILRHPVFDEDKIDLAKVGERSSISRRNDQPMQIAMREFGKAIFGADSPYARHTEYATIDAVTRDDLIEFHRAYFHPENTQMAIWGDIDKQEIVDKLTKLFGDWERGTTVVPPPPKVEYNYDQKIFYAEKTDVNQSNILIGHIGGLITDPDYAERIVMNKVMGVGFGSRMVDAIRSREGLAYATFSSYTADIAYPGTFFAYTGTKSETTGKAINIMHGVIKSMQTDPPTADELAHGKESYLNSFVFNFDSKAEVVNRIMTYDHYGIPDDFLQKVKEKVENVTAEDVVEAAKRNLHPDQLRLLVVGKAEDFDIHLDSLGLGPVETIDISIPSGEQKRELAITPENLQKGRELLNLAVAAHGGLDNFKKITSLSTTGNVTMSMQGHEFSFQVEELRVLPRKKQAVYNIMGRQLYDIRNEDMGWKTDQMSGEIVAKTEDDLLKDNLESSRDFILVCQRSDDPDSRAVWDGTGAVNGASVEFVVLVDNEGEIICSVALDASSHQLVSMEYWGESPMGEGNIEKVFADWTEIEGVKLPMREIVNMSGQEVSSLTYSRFDVNPEIPADAFTKPQ